MIDKDYTKPFQCFKQGYLQDIVVQLGLQVPIGKTHVVKNA